MPSPSAVLYLPPKKAREICTRALKEEGWEIENSTELFITGWSGKYEFMIDFKLLSDGLGVYVTTNQWQSTINRLIDRMVNLANDEAASINQQPIEQRKLLAEAAFDAKVFLSYAREDAEFAVKLEKDLFLFGFDVWIDQGSLRVGDNWPDKIKEAIDESQAVVVILSPNVEPTSWVHQEVDRAQKKKKLLVPVVYQAGELPAHLAEKFGTIEYGKLFGRKYKAALYQLAGVIKERFASEPG
jgi:hypothetical protein